jgi:DNA-binding XRE family transcriptional regulator
MVKPRQELIRCRVATGLTAAEQAATVGVAKGTLLNAEAGEPVRLATARRLAEHYGRTISELFPESENRLTLNVPAHTNGTSP